jgi:mannosylglycerate hydrolase
MSTPQTPKTAVVFSHCHWDIEWYLPFRSFRFWLIHILDTLQTRFPAHPSFRNYMLDGQVAPLDHYLEIRPECQEAVKALVRSGSLSVGPFYTQYDEWLNSPESIVRNCLYGNRRARDFGGVMKAGYLPDNFGHPLQMPQILAGFGLNSLLFMRGMPDRPEGFGDQFLWQGLDGTQVLAVHFSHGYHNAVAAGTGFDFSSVHRTTPYQDAYRTAEPFWRSADHTDIDAGARSLIQSAEKEDPLCPSGIIPLANGVDHMPPQAFVGEMIERANQLQTTYRFIHTDVAELTRLIRETGTELPVYREELYGAKYQLILTGTLALRAYLKQDNFASEALMEQYAEPLATLAMLSGAAYPERMLEEAWKFLFVNQAHDGIHGSSADPVHVEMRQRYAAVRQVATGICHHSLAFLGQKHAVPRPNASPLLVYAPAVSSFGTAVVDTWIAAGADFQVVDQDGRFIPVQLVPNPHEYPAPAADACGTISWPGAPVDKHVVFEAALPANAPTTFHVVASSGAVAKVSEFKCSDCSVENSQVRVAVTASGLEITDKATGRSYAGALEFEDEADAGDAWDFSPTWKPEPPVSTRGIRPRVSLVESGPVRASLRLETTLQIPRGLQGESRSVDVVETIITTTISITASSMVVSIVTELDNQAKDHRLRMKIPTGLAATTVRSETLFGAIQRPLRHPAEGRDQDWFQMAPKTFPFREWVAVDDGAAGLAVACRGMYEYESREEGGKVSLFVTLLRCLGVMGKHNMPYRKHGTSPGNPTPDAQCQGACRFEYALIPFRPGKVASTPFLAEARSFLYPPIAHQVLVPDAAAKVQPPLFVLEPATLQVSAFKKAQDGKGVVVRLWENDGCAVKTKIQLSPAISKVFLCNLNEEIESEIPIRKQTIAVTATPYKILTLLFLPV